LWSLIESPAQQYWRRLKDLPIQGRSVQLKLHVGRWRCRNPVCKRKIFCLTGKYRQETKRFEEVAQVIGHALGGRAGERLSDRLGLRISDDTLLRRVKQAAQARLKNLNRQMYGRAKFELLRARTLPLAA
jgi:transposase